MLHSIAPVAHPLEAEFLSEEQVARILGYTVSTLRTKQCRGDDLPVYLRYGRRIRYRAADVAAWLETRKRCAPVGTR